MLWGAYLDTRYYWLNRWGDRNRYVQIRRFKPNGDTLPAINTQIFTISNHQILKTNGRGVASCYLTGTASWTYGFQQGYPDYFMVIDTAGQFRNFLTIEHSVENSPADFCQIGSKIYAVGSRVDNVGGLYTSMYFQCFDLNGVVWADTLFRNNLSTVSYAQKIQVTDRKTLFVSGSVGSRLCS
jgi:hypothetical protein